MQLAIIKGVPSSSYFSPLHLIFSLTFRFQTPTITGLCCTNTPSFIQQKTGKIIQVGMQYYKTMVCI
jgi:hypothetical protein